jgi:hypothetical protein
MKPSRLQPLHAACTAAAVALLAGCSGSSSFAPSGSSVSGPSGTSNASVSRAQSQGRGSVRSGGARPGVVARITQVEPSHVLTAEAAKGGPKDLAVTDYVGNTYILNHTYHLVTTIGGFGGADGARYDTHGNLYVVDYVNSVVDEYNPSDSLIAQYSTGTSNPINVTTDGAGHVYVADYGGETIVEFPQGVNTPSASCSTGLANEGIAVDAKHNVFVSGNESVSGGPGLLAEFKGGLKGCKETSLSGVSLSFAGGLQIDNHHDLVACDQGVGVDIIPPPYTSISSTITGAADSFHVALNKKNTLIFIADLGNSDVLVDRYPSGTNVTTIGAANGLDGAAGVATFPN